MLRADQVIRWCSIGSAVAAVAVLGVTVFALSRPDLSPWSEAAYESRLGTYQLGQEIDVPRAAYGHTAVTALVFASSACGACQASAPVLTEMVDQLAEEGIPSNMILVSERSDVSLAFAHRAGFVGSSVWHVPADRLRAKRVPLVVLVDRLGTVLFQKVGLLDSESGSEIVLAAVAALRSS